MTLFVCVQAENYCGRGADYVNILFDSVMRNLPMEKRGKFVCFTDSNEGLHHGIEVRPLRGGLKSWWNKLWLFKSGHFPEGERIVYFDLDTVIVGNLSKIVEYTGPLALLRDFYRPEGLGSGVMCWSANEHSEIWDHYESSGFPDVKGGDQAWIENLITDTAILQDAMPDMFCSYKVNHGLLPEKAAVVCFHDIPRPHEITGAWVPKMWRVGGVSRAEIMTIANAADDIEPNIRKAMQRDLEWHTPQPEHDGSVCIVGGGPSLKGHESIIKSRQEAGQKIWSINGAYNYLLKHEIIPDVLILTDARKENAQFVSNPQKETVFYIAAQCAPDIFECLTGYNVRLLHLNIPGMAQLVVEKYAVGPGQQACLLASPGGTTGMTALYLARNMGFRDILLYGMDSCYLNGDGHSYPQSLNDGERIIDVWVEEKQFRCAPWMYMQAKAFSENLKDFTDSGCVISVAGGGLLAEIVRASQEAT